MRASDILTLLAVAGLSAPEDVWGFRMGWVISCVAFAMCAKYYEQN